MSSPLVVSQLNSPYSPIPAFASKYPSQSAAAHSPPGSWEGDDGGAFLDLCPEGQGSGGRSRRLAPNRHLCYRLQSLHLLQMTGEVTTPPAHV